MGIVLMALAFGVISIIPEVKAHAALVDAIDSDSITITSTKVDGAPVYV
ncbi:MAG: hypothetical protein Q4D79_14390 [Propionibacteriaceae bacterium]|nr:hypothetical protein [Propionibacteriaceae bacterium]